MFDRDDEEVDSLALGRPKDWFVEDEIRIMLKEQRKKDKSTAACKAWAREFVQSIVDGWKPGQPLTLKQAQTIGAEFDRQLLRLRRKVPRLERPPYKHRQP